MNIALRATVGVVTHMNVLKSAVSIALSSF